METLDIGIGVYGLNKGNGLDMSAYQQIEELARLGHNLTVYHVTRDLPDVEGVEFKSVPRYRQPYNTPRLAGDCKLNSLDFFASWGSPFIMLSPFVDNHVMVEFGIPPVHMAASKWEAFVNGYIRGMTIWASRHSRVILAGSEYLYNNIIPYAKHKENVFVSHSGIKFDKGMAIPELPPYALFVGRHVPYKGVDHLRRLFQKVKTRVPNARLVTIGNGGTYADDLWGFYRSASVYATCSRWEGEDRPALEAQSMGLPVVSYNNCSHPEVVHYGRRVQDDKVFVDTLTEYLEEPRVNPYIGQYVRDEYGVSEVVRKWLGHVRKVIV